MNKFDFIKRCIEHLLDSSFVSYEERMNNEELVKTYKRNQNK